MPSPDVDRLKGVRLGKIERALLRRAPSPNNYPGLALATKDFPRAVAEGTLRSARKLRDCGLVDLEIVRVPTRAPDPRRERPVYRGGAFYQHEEPTRWHVRLQSAIWRTPLGWGVESVYHEALVDGRPIRWTDSRLKKVMKAARREEHYVSHAGRRSWLEEFEQEVRDRVEQETPKPRIAEPPEVRTTVDRLRWRDAVACAVRASRKGAEGDSDSLWSAAREFYNSPDELPPVPRPRPDRERPARTPTDAFLDQLGPLLWAK